MRAYFTGLLTKLKILDLKNKLETYFLGCTYIYIFFTKKTCILICLQVSCLPINNYLLNGFFTARLYSSEHLMPTTKDDFRAKWLGA